MQYRPRVFIIAGILSAFLLIAIPTYSATKSYLDTLCKKPTPGIVAAVCELKDRVVALEKRAPIPGPQGPIGSQGPKGDKGDPGPQGLQGESNWDEQRMVELETRVNKLENLFVNCPNSLRSVLFEDKDSSGAVLQDNDKKAILMYCVRNNKLDYAFSGRVPIANDWYALVAGEDPLDHPETAVIMNYPRSHGDTGDVIVQGSIALNDNLINSQVWMVLGAHLMLLPHYDGYTGWNGWHPEYYLFGTDLLNFTY